MSEPARSGEILARDGSLGRWSGIGVHVVVEDGIVTQFKRTDEEVGGDSWITPGSWDIQTNGRWGISFSSPDLSVDDVIRIVRAQRELGTTRLCPTLITASFEATLHGVTTIVAACEAEPLVDRMVVGIHLEGPWISSEDGYRGAHPIEHARDPVWSEFEAWWEASRGRIRIVTLAPERQGVLFAILKLRQLGIVVALGHTAATGPTLKLAAEAGATLSTHLGNGIAANLPRHPNPIWHQAADPRLAASFIADGHHLDLDTLRVLAQSKAANHQTILVSDASPLAGLGPGTYGDWAVDPSGKIVVAGTPYLAGSNQGLDVGLTNLRLATGWSVGQTIQAATRNPARLLGVNLAAPKAGDPAELNLVEVPSDGGPWRVRPWP